MVKCTKVCEWDSPVSNKFVVIFSRYQGKLLLSRHKSRETWETQGGHIEPGEIPEAAARRELWEESGALDFDLEPVCAYWAEDEAGGAWGVVFFADIRSIGPLPQSEMAEVKPFDALPQNITYPGITPTIYQQVRERFEPAPGT